MSVTITPVTPADAPDLARICFQAFAVFQDHHATPRDFDSPETAAGLMGMLTTSTEVVGFAARDAGALVGSNFITFTDDVAGIGPITIDPAHQSRGTGRALMRAVLDEASRRGVRQVRLLQEAVNITSLSLYASLGFAWRDSVALMQLSSAAATTDTSIRPMTEADLTDADALARAHYASSRRNEVANALRAGFPAFVSRRADRATGYLIPGFLGHGFAADAAEMVRLISHAAAVAPPMFQRVFVPLSQDELFRALLSRGCRTAKVMSYMTVGPYTTPRAAWMPSILN